MQFSISEDQFKILVEELEYSQSLLYTHVTTLVLAENNGRAKKFAERVVKLSALIHDIKQTASQV